MNNNLNGIQFEERRVRERRIMFGLGDNLTEEQAVDHSLSIDRLVGDKLRKLKDEKNRQRIQRLQEVI
jgi:hypothetical protein